MDWTVCSSAVEDLDAVGVELDVDAVDVDTSTPDRLPR